jgi:hypothetical protein
MRKFVLALLFPLFFLTYSSAQTKTETVTEADKGTETNLPKGLGGALGRFEFNGPKGSSGADFEFFRLMKIRGQDIHDPRHNRDGSVPISGSLVTIDGTYYPFRIAFLRTRPSGEYEEIEFVTSRVKGISYRFHGKFLEKIVQEKAGGPYSDLRGVITRNENGKLTSTKSLPFSAFPEL